MTEKLKKSGSELFIVDNSDQDWKVLQYLKDWCQLSEAIDIATGYFEIGSLLLVQSGGGRLCLDATGQRGAAQLSAQSVRI